MGPLSKSCGHKYHVKKLIEKDASGKWQTSPSSLRCRGTGRFSSVFRWRWCAANDHCGAPDVSGSKDGMVRDNSNRGDRVASSVLRGAHRSLLNGMVEVP